MQSAGCRRDFAKELFSARQDLVRAPGDGDEFFDLSMGPVSRPRPRILSPDASNLPPLSSATIHRVRFCKFGPGS